MKGEWDLRRIMVHLFTYDFPMVFIIFFPLIAYFNHQMYSKNSQNLSFLCNNHETGLYHLTGLVHISEVSWDLVQDVRDILTEGDQVRVKILSVDR